MKKKIGIYLIKNEVNGKVYIGNSTDIDRRWYNHKMELKNEKHHSPKLQRAYNKYGKDAFFYEVIQYCSKEDLISNEQYWIDKMDSFESGYNCTDNLINPSYNNKSRTGHVISEETRKKMSESQQKRPKMTEETKKKISIAAKGRKRKPFSDEWKRKIGEASKGNSYAKGNKRVLSEEEKAALLLINIGNQYAKGKPSKRKGRKFPRNNK